MRCFCPKCNKLIGTLYNPNNMDSRLLECHQCGEKSPFNTFRFPDEVLS